MMKKIIIIGFTGLCILGMQSCKKKVKVISELKNTSWVSEDGSRTLEFTKKNVLLDGEELRDGKEVFYADEEGDGGQFWLEEKDEITYIYDYKISGENLFIAPENTSAWEDPSSPKTENTVKFKQQ